MELAEVCAHGGSEGCRPLGSRAGHQFSFIVSLTEHRPMGLVW